MKTWEAVAQLDSHEAGCVLSLVLTPPSLEWLQGLPRLLEDRFNFVENTRKYITRTPKEIISSVKPSRNAALLFPILSEL